MTEQGLCNGSHAMESCEASGHAVSDHFRGVTKLIVHGKSEESVVNHWLTTAADGKSYRVAHYNAPEVFPDGQAQVQREATDKEFLTVQTKGALRIPTIFVASRNWS